MNQKLVSKNKSFTKRLLALTTILLSIVLVACGKSDEEILEGSWMANEQSDENYVLYSLNINKEKNIYITRGTYSDSSDRIADEKVSYKGAYFRKGDNFFYSVEEEALSFEDGQQVRKNEDNLEIVKGTIKAIDENHIEVDGLEFERYES
ncbi:hypothetical protein [Staphylococcus felis]|uniref:Lipocalin-like domain-containing protein n=1 Tax=Staphylococcus felis TaxID=46127 RepID=A0A3E0INZ5_9STAP|nr:hypothetical protein [Staphylococcus felis]REH94321.1 hypothetical protein DOS83_07680 [Staphylococcus felis]